MGDHRWMKASNMLHRGDIFTHVLKREMKKIFSFSVATSPFVHSKIYTKEKMVIKKKEERNTFEIVSLFFVTFPPSSIHSNHRIISANDSFSFLASITSSPMYVVLHTPKLKLYSITNMQRVRERE